MLKPVCEWFKEGIDEIDLKLAATVLDELESAPKTKQVTNNRQTKEKTYDN